MVTAPLQASRRHLAAQGIRGSLHRLGLKQVEFPFPFTALCQVLEFYAWMACVNYPVTSASKTKFQKFFLSNTSVVSIKVVR